MTTNAKPVSHCNNGGCTRPVFRGKECLRCWLGTKWDSMKQRCDHKNDHNRTYNGIELHITRQQFLEWAKVNPPPLTMKCPSIDRIETRGHYTLDNIRWLEFRINSRRNQRDTPDGFCRCPRCGKILPLTPDYFRRCRKDAAGFQTTCKICKQMRVPSVLTQPTITR